MFVKPTQKLKRVLRVYLTYERKETEDVLKVFGRLHLTSQSKMVTLPKFTSFFKQISFSFLGEPHPFETVLAE
jgi:hypothetical protein